MPEPPATDPVHPAAAVGFQRAADAYDRGRPGFPDDAVAFLVRQLALGPSVTLLELGAGTGKLTRLLAKAAAPRILAVEPVPAMRGRLGGIPGVTPLDAVAEALPLESGDAQAAVAAQAFHWFDAGRALAELARVLPPGAPLALVWNVRDESVGWVARFTDVIEPYRAGTPSYRSMRWRDAFGSTTAFTAPERTAFPYAAPTTPDGVRDRALSISFIAALPARERARVAARVRDLLPPGGAVFPYRTEVWLSRRR